MNNIISLPILIIVLAIFSVNTYCLGQEEQIEISQEDIEEESSQDTEEERIKDFYYKRPPIRPNKFSLLCDTKHNKTPQLDYSNVHNIGPYDFDLVAYDKNGKELKRDSFTADRLNNGRDFKSPPSTVVVRMETKCPSIKPELSECIMTYQ